MAARGVALVLPIIFSLFAAGSAEYLPRVIGLEDLEQGAGDGIFARFEEAVGEDGIIAVDIPNFSKIRESVLLAALTCTKTSPHSLSRVLADGTERRSLASVTRGDEADVIDHGAPQSCRDLDEHSKVFRDLVARAARAFTKRVASAFFPAPAMRGSALWSSTGKGYSSVDELVHHGEQLEHFHTYTPGYARGEAPATVDFHTDQGLFIAFALPLMASGPCPVTGRAVGSEQSAGLFKVILKEGPATVDMQALKGAVVFMLGDGAERILGPRQARGPALRAVPHSFSMPDGLESRLWYGRMFLPPSDLLLESTGLSFGEERQAMMDAGRQLTEDKGVLAMGCSGKLYARELAATVNTSCGSNAIFCWYQCMPYTASANPSVCAAQGMQVNCTDIFGQIYMPKDYMGDYFPNCTTSTKLVTSPPTVVQPNVSACPSFATETSTAGYSTNVISSGETVLMWKSSGSGLSVKMVSTGWAGWMAVGLQGPPVVPSHNPSTPVGPYGMAGGHVVMGTNDLVNGKLIGEYAISLNYSAWRHWKTPLSPSVVQDANFQLTDCLSILTFTTSTVYGQPFSNQNGPLNLIYALSRSAYVTQNYGGFAPYHTDVVYVSSSPRFRGFVTIPQISASATAPSASTTAASQKTSGAACRMADIRVLTLSLTLVIRFQSLAFVK